MELSSCRERDATSSIVRTLPRRAYCQVLILVTSRAPTDDFDAAYDRLIGSWWGPYAFRLAIAIGGAADEKIEGFKMCKKFCSRGMSVVRVNSTDQIKKAMHWGGGIPGGECHSGMELLFTLQTAPPVPQSVGGGSVPSPFAPPPSDVF
jgi:hypothetical protein